MVELLLSLFTELKRADWWVWLGVGTIGWVSLTLIARFILRRLGEGLMYLLVPVGIVLLFVDGSIETIAEFIGTKSTNIGASLIGAIIGFNLYHTLAYGGNDEYVPEEEEKEENGGSWDLLEEENDRLIDELSRSALGGWAAPWNFLSNDKD